MELIVTIMFILAAAWFVCKRFLFWFLEIYQRANLPLILDIPDPNSGNGIVPIRDHHSTQQGTAEITQNGSVQQSVHGDRRRVAADTTSTSPSGEGPLVSIASASPNPGEYRGLPSREARYDVFINHRGPDVKSTFADSVYEILLLKGVRAFLDQGELQKGEGVSQVIVDTIKHASVQLAIFSKGYAESTWCLDELCLMIESGAKLIPIFYDVQPSDLRYIKGKSAYTEAFSNHEKKRRYTDATVLRWKRALHDASLLSGWVLDEFKGPA